MTPSTTIEFLVWLLLAASMIAVIAARLRIPYTVALVVGGLVLGSFHLPIVHTLFANSPDWLTPDVSLVIFLPALLFEGSLKIQLRQLRESVIPICLLATVGNIAATLIFRFRRTLGAGNSGPHRPGFRSHCVSNNPISVLAIFEHMAVDKRLTIIVEGESLFNDGTAVVLYGILVGAVANSRLNILTGVRDFAVAVAGGAAVGAVLGFACSRLTQRLDDPEIEITLTTIAAYGSYLLAR